MFNFKIGGRNCNSSSSADERHYLLQDKIRCRLDWYTGTNVAEKPAPFTG